MSTRRLLLLSALVGLSAGSARAQAASFATVQRGATIVTEDFTLFQDSLTSALHMGPVLVSSRLKSRDGAPSMLDAIASTGSGQQHVHIDVAAQLAKVHFDGPTFNIDTAVVLPKDTAVVVYYNLAFSMLQPLAKLRPKVGEHPRDVAILMAQNGHVEYWNLRAVAADTVYVTTTRGIHITLSFAGDRLTTVRVDAQDLVATMKPAASAGVPRLH
jgi:hypothetical protein